MRWRRARSTRLTSARSAVVIFPENESGRSFSQRVRRVTDFGFTRETGRRFYFFYIIGGDPGRPGGRGGRERNE